MLFTVLSHAVEPMVLAGGAGVGDSDRGFALAGDGGEHRPVHQVGIVATACRDGGVRRWDVATGQRIEPVLWHSDWAIFVECDAEGRRLLTGSEDGTAQVWDAASGSALGKKLSHQGWVRAGQFSPDGTWVATASVDQTVRLGTRGRARRLRVRSSMMEVCVRSSLVPRDGDG
jgi:WD40 repeat protein